MAKVNVTPPTNRTYSHCVFVVVSLTFLPLFKEPANFSALPSLYTIEAVVL